MCLQIADLEQRARADTHAERPNANDCGGGPQLPGGAAGSQGLASGAAAMAAREELTMLLTAEGDDLPAVDAALAKYGGGAGGRLGVVGVLQRLQTRRTVLLSRPAASSYSQLGRAGADISRLESSNAQLRWLLDQGAADRKTAEQKAEDAAAVTNVLALRIGDLRRRMDQLNKDRGDGGGQQWARRCPVCRTAFEGADGGKAYREHALRCVNKVSLRRLLAAAERTRVCGSLTITGLCACRS